MTNRSITKQKSRVSEKRFIRFHQVLAITSLSRSELYRRIANGSFPRQIHLGSRSVVWLESEVFGWMDALVEQTAVREA